LNLDLSKFDGFLYSKMSEAKLPSLTVAIIKDNAIFYTRTFGLKNIESGWPTTIKTNYGIGSITKSFTALGIGKLVEEGKIKFRDLVIAYLPEFKKYKAFEELEIHHLLSHSSGIPALGSAEVLIFNAIGLNKKWMPTATSDDMVTFFDQVDEWRLTDPGKRYFYFNEGYNLLGEIISRVSQRDYVKFIKEEILKPLEMNRSFFSKEELENDKDYAMPYLIKDGKPVLSVIPWGAGAAGGLMSNIIDLSHYITMYLSRGEYNGKRIIGKDIVRQMETPYSKPPLNLLPNSGYGYGLFISPDFYGEKLVRHDGSVGVYTSSMAYLPESKLGILALCNSEGYNLSLFSLYGLISMLGKNPEDFAPIKREKLLSRLEGDYYSYKDTVSAQLKKNGDFLILSGEDIGENIVLVPESIADNGERHITFYTLRSTAKLIVEFNLGQHDVEMIFERYRYKKRY
jgi:CubicO group peptidase (beta-lactamase class C family)